MMILLLVSFVVLFPKTLSAAQSVEIPTHVQILDHAGNTSVEIPVSKKIAPRAAIPSLSNDCQTSMTTPSSTTSPHLLSPIFFTRFASAQYRVKHAAQSLIFSPYLSPQEENQIQSAIEKQFDSLLYSTSSSALPKILDCLERFTEKIDPNQKNNETLARLRELVGEILYASRLTQEGTSPPAPTTVGEAQYLSDLLKSQDVRIISFSLGSEGLSLTYELRATLLSVIETSYPLTITLDSEGTRVKKPWWVFFTDHPQIEENILLHSPTSMTISSTSSFVLRALELLQSA